VKKSILSLMTLSILLMTAGCSKEADQLKEVKLTPFIYKVTVNKVQSYIEATGSVQADLEGGAKILPPVPGVVDRILVKHGDKVAAGTPLLSLRSIDVNDAYTGYLASLTQLRQAERIYQLNKQLFEIGAMTRNDLLASEAAYEQAKTASEGLKNKLEIYGALSSSGFQDKLTIKSPIDGYVAELQARIGDRFDTNTAMMTIANPGKIIVVANIYDTDVPRLRKNQDVSFSTDIFPDVLFKGAITYISDVEDSDSKTVKTYIRIQNHRGLLKQNMFLKIRIIDKEKQLAVIPKSALIYKNGIFYVNVKAKEQTELKEVKPIRDTSDKLMAVDGLSEGEEIVYSAIELEKP
jgi:cobalt-zinc-cadmium efflux system membrane fusion protein